MKRTAHELANPIVGRTREFYFGRNLDTPRPINPNAISRRCEADGVTVSPAAIISRMRRHDLTYEEAIAYVPETHRKAGQIGKKTSYWNKTTPGSPLDQAAREGKVKPKEKK